MGELADWAAGEGKCHINAIEAVNGSPPCTTVARVPGNDKSATKVLAIKKGFAQNNIYKESRKARRMQI